jgi:ABC-2 type transport system permease protein
MWERIREIIRKEFRQTLRDGRARALLIGPPLIQLIIFGYAVNLDVENTRMAWLDMDRTPESRALLADFQGSPYFQVTSILTRQEEIADELDHARVQAVVSVLPGYARDIVRGRTTEVQILVDGSNSNTAGIIANYFNQVVAARARAVLAKQQNARLVAGTESAGGPLRTSLPGIDIQSRVWFNPNLKSRDYFVPGVIVNIIALVTVMLTALGIVREKEIGTMEQLMVTPIRSWQLLVGKLFPFAVIGFVQTLLITTVTVWGFEIRLEGSLALLLGLTMLFVLGNLGLGLLVSTVVGNQQQAMMGAAFVLLIPMILLSGLIFPIENMPRAIQYVTYAIPVRYYAEIIRGIFLRGSGIDVLWPQALVLLAMGVSIMIVAVLRFRKRLD